MSTRRFLLYVKAASNGKDIGDCPFSQRVLMFCKLKVPSDKIDINTVDIANKSDDFRKENEVIADSADINKYLEQEFPECDCKVGYTGPAIDACSGVFPKLAALLKNKDKSKNDFLKTELISELSKVNEYLESDSHKGKFLIGDEMNEIDCMFLPRLRHVIVAADHYAGIKIPDEMSVLKQYVEDANKTEAFSTTCCPDDEIIKGWSRHVI
ncbi:unnamed protein product [Mytilus edulis]|uniref:CLIC N-terminal domain-containing protein n=1 Tax=Mytilus edulis TaxID=6550 RepID=A0A8S3UPY3_MYTED|nr:unnamed protein product [Mytilus edulis]